MKDLFVIQKKDTEKRVKMTRDLVLMFKSNEDDYLNKVLSRILEYYLTGK